MSIDIIDAHFSKILSNIKINIHEYENIVIINNDYLFNQVLSHCLICLKFDYS